MKLVKLILSEINELEKSREPIKLNTVIDIYQNTKEHERLNYIRDYILFDENNYKKDNTNYQNGKNKRRNMCRK